MQAGGERMQFGHFQLGGPTVFTSHFHWGSNRNKVQKSLKQNEEMKQDALGSNNWNKSEINGLNCVENGRP